MINQRYFIKRKLGEGRSKVFSVIDSEFPDKEIAIKVLPANVLREESDAFRQEYFTLRKLDHPNIIKAFDLGMVLSVDEDDHDIETGSLFITLERFDSIDLLDYQQLKDEEKLVSIIKQICSVLYYLHQSNYIYYDLKPENILLSVVKDKPIIKIIDLGLTKYMLSEGDYSVRGTAEYIAPELLKKEPHDHAVDLYSLGILIYRIIYGRFPFDAKSELDIYKAHIDGHFDFPPVQYSQQLIDVVKKLLEKDPEERYGNSLQVLFDLGVDLNIQVVKDFLPARVLSSRKDILNVVKSYVNDSKSNEVFTLRGFSGAGKTEVLSELNSIYQESVYIENTRRKTGVELVRYFLHKLLYSETIYNNVKADDQESINNLFETSELEVSDSIKALILRVTENKQFLLLIDDYNLYDDFAKDTINEFFPIFQINKIKVIIAETSEFDYATENLFNVQHIQITPFTERQLSEYLDLAFFSSFPKQKLRKVILDYSDLLPGSIIQFIKDILVLGIMRYEADDIKFYYEGNIEEALKGSHEQIYRLRLSNLSEDELKVAQLISAFDISVEQIVLSSILNKSSRETEEILRNLQYKNIIQPLSISNSPNIISDSFKRYIYSTISEKRKYHLIIASLIKRVLPEFNTIELARQYRLGGETKKVIELVNKEIQKAESLSAYSYKRKLIEDLLTLDINEDIRVSLLSELVKTMFKQSDYVEALKHYEAINFELVDDKTKRELNFIQGSSLISIRKIEEGIKALQTLLSSENEDSRKQKILVEIAYAEFELSNYKEAENLALNILNSKDSTTEDRGKCFNLLGMIKVYSSEDMDRAIEFFNKALEMYRQAHLPRRVAGVEVNLGNIYNILGDYENSEKHWENALRINESIGNIEQNAIILMSFGVYFKHKFDFENAFRYTSSAENIFSSIGNENYRAVVLTNLGEINLSVCEYQKSLESFTIAVNIFQRLKNYLEKADALFDIGKLSYHLSDIDLLQSTILDYQNCFPNGEYPSSYKLNLSILYFFEKFIYRERVEFESALELLNEYNETNEKRNYLELFSLFFDYFIHQQESNADDILNTLFSETCIKDAESNKFFNAYREYFLGQIASLTTDIRLLPPIEHFEKAFSLIENEAISELTWKVLAAISDTYMERGFLNKAKKPLIYAAELLNYIAENIKNPAMRTKYISKPERQKVFQSIKAFNIPTAVQ